MRSLPINNEKDEELAKAFEEVDKIESILQNERKVAPSLKFNIE